MLLLVSVYIGPPIVARSMGPFATYLTSHYVGLSQQPNASAFGTTNGQRVGCWLA